MTFDFKFYLSVFFRRFHYFFLIMAIVSASGITVALMLPAKYEAQALLLLEQPQIPDELAASTVRTGAPVQMSIIRQQLTSRATVLEIADKMQVYPNRSVLDPNAIIADMRKRISIVERFKRGSAPTLLVGFSGGDPRMAAAVANELVTRVLEKNVELRTGNATQTLEFFEQEAARLEEEIQVKSNRILQFKLENQNALPDSIEYRRARQTSMQERLGQIDRDIRSLQERRTNLVDLFERTGRVDTAAADLTPEQRQLQDLERQLESALLVYSERNPRVRILQSKVESLKTAVSAQSGGTQDDSPTLYEIQLADIASQVEILERQRQETTTELEDLLKTIEETPRNAIRLGELDRSLDSSQQQFNSTMRNLSTAQMGERIEVMSKGQRLSVIEAAVVPRSPASPNRPLIAAASVGGGLILGIAFVILLELLSSAIRRPVELKSKLGITPIATLPYVRTRRQTILHRSIIIGVISIVVVAFPMIIFGLHTFYLPIDLLVERLLDRSGIGAIFNSGLG